jgi:hypothetical protein
MCANYESIVCTGAEACVKNGGCRHHVSLADAATKKPLDFQKQDAGEANRKKESEFLFNGQGGYLPGDPPCRRSTREGR